MAWKIISWDVQDIRYTGMLPMGSFNRRKKSRIMQHKLEQHQAESVIKI